MRVEIFRKDEQRFVKPERLQRFLDSGWHLAQPEPKKVSKPKLKPEVKAVADVVEAADHDWEAPLISMPTNDLKED